MKQWCPLYVFIYYSFLYNRIYKSLAKYMPVYNGYSQQSSKTTAFCKTKLRNFCSLIQFSMHRLTSWLDAEEVMMRYFNQWLPSLLRDIWVIRPRWNREWNQLVHMDQLNTMKNNLMFTGNQLNSDGNWLLNIGNSAWLYTTSRLLRHLYLQEGKLYIYIYIAI